MIMSGVPEKRYLLLCLACMALVLVSCGKRDEAGEMKKLQSDFAKSEQVSINREIARLYDQIQSTPDDYSRAVIYTSIATLQERKGDVASMMKSAAMALDRQPDMARAYYLRGKGNAIMNRIPQALEDVGEAIRLDPAMADARCEMGNLLFREGKYREAVERYREALDRDAGNQDALNNMGVACFRAGQYRESEKALIKATTLPDVNPRVYKNLGILYEQGLKDRAKAVVWYRKYLESRPGAHDRIAVTRWLGDLGATL